MIHRIDGHGLDSPPATISWKSGDVPPPGRPITQSASPASTKLAARVTMMSGTPEAVMISPITVASPTVIASTPTAIARQAPRL